MPFTKGDPNINRNGRPPKDWTWSDIFEQEVEKIGKDNKEAMKVRMVRIMIKKALEGDVQAFREISNRMDGLPKQEIKQILTGELSLTDILSKKKE